MSLHHIAPRDDYDPAWDNETRTPPRYVEPGTDPWACWCGEHIPIDEPPCTHGLYLCAEHVDRCSECVAERADAREDFDRQYEKENRHDVA